MIQTHTIGQPGKAAQLSKKGKYASTDWLTLQASTLAAQMNFNFRLFGLDQQPSHQCREWYDSLQFYDAPEMERACTPVLQAHDLIRQIRCAKRAGYSPKPSIPGPISLANSLVADENERLDLFNKLLPLYARLLAVLAAEKLEWLQLDEPMLSTKLSREWRHAYRSGYFALQRSGLKLMVTTGKGALGSNLQLACNLPVQAIHIDACSSPEQVLRVIDWLPRHKQLSLGIISADSVGKSDLNALLATLKPYERRLKDRLWLSALEPCCY